MHALCWRGDVDVAHAALDASTDGRAAATARNFHGRTPAHLLCAGSRPYFSGAMGRASLLRRLLDLGADVNAADGRGETPLHEACRSGDPLLVKTLVARGADELASNNRAQIPVQVAGPPHHKSTVGSSGFHHGL